MKKFSLIFAITLLFVFSATAQTSEEILQLLKDRVDVARSNVSITVAVIDEKGTRFINYGKISKDANAADVDEHTLYEIGSVTKTFVGTLFAEAIRRGEVKPDDPISKYLPKDVKTPKRNGKEITLLDLATHTAGFGVMPSNFDRYPISEVYARYTTADAFQFLSSYELPREPGEKYVYSNFGMGLLAYILCERAKMPFEKLVTKRILKPLKMNETTFTTAPKSKLRMASAYDNDREPTYARSSGSPIFMGSGSIVSTASDMAKWVSANLGITKTKLLPILLEAQKPNRVVNSATKIGYAWNTSESPKYGKIISHSGGTAGFASDVKFDRERKRGVVVLTNTFDESIPKFSTYIFDQRLSKPVVKPDLSLASEILDKYIGEYELAPGITITVTRVGDKVFVEPTGQGKIRVYAKSQNEFDLRVVEATVIFDRDAAGNVTGLTLLQDGQKQVAKKIK